MLYFIYIYYFILEGGCSPRVRVVCDASTFTEHENHQTSNLNMKYSGEHNKRQCPDHRHTFAANRQRSQARATPRCQLLHQTKAIKEPPSPLQTTVSYGIILSHGHESTATSAKRQFNKYIHTVCVCVFFPSILDINSTPQNYTFIGSSQEPCSPLPPPLAQFSLCTEPVAPIAQR